MPVSVEIDTQNRVVVCKAWGTLTDADLHDCRQKISNDPAFTPDLNQLFDFSDVERVELTSGGIRSLADHNLFGAGSRRAFTIEPGALAMYGMARMFQILTDDHLDELNVHFDHIKSARAWLGLPVNED